jgi:hypothetical protein
MVSSEKDYYRASKVSSDYFTNETYLGKPSLTNIYLNTIPFPLNFSEIRLWNFRFKFDKNNLSFKMPKKILRSASGIDADTDSMARLALGTDGLGYQMARLKSYWLSIGIGLCKITNKIVFFSGWPMAHQVVRPGMRQLRHFLARQWCLELRSTPLGNVHLRRSGSLQYPILKFLAQFSGLFNIYTQCHPEFQGQLNWRRRYVFKPVLKCFWRFVTAWFQLNLKKLSNLMLNFL